MFTFHIENHEPFEALTKNGKKLDKNVSRFSVFVSLQISIQLVPFKIATM